MEEGEDCVGEFVSPVSGEESAARHIGGEADDNDSFVVIMGGITAVGYAESEGWSFADAMARDEVSVISYSLLRIFYVACVHPICWLF